MKIKITIKDCEMSTFSVSGAGGQRRDHTNTGVRLVHRQSGAVGVGTESRKQSDNKRTAFLKLVDSVDFRMWYRKQLGLSDPTETQKVTQIVRTYNLVDNRVTDHRTKDKSAQVDAILDGDIDLLYN